MLTRLSNVDRTFDFAKDRADMKLASVKQKLGSGEAEARFPLDTAV